MFAVWATYAEHILLHFLAAGSPHPDIATKAEPRQGMSRSAR